MQFVLHYRGPLRSNGSIVHKHELRCAFHSQLKTLWNQLPLSEYPDFVKPTPELAKFSLLRPFLGYTFVPLVSAQLNVIAELHLTLLRPEPPGNLITQGGDIDNRIKTLFDALTMPRHSNALPNSSSPTEEQVPFFFCLLEDDNLVTKISISTEQLLEIGNDDSQVELFIDVKTVVSQR